MGIRRTLRLCKHIFYSNTLKYSTHSATSDKTCTSCCRLKEHMGTTKSSFHLMGHSTFQDWNLNKVFLSGFNTFGNSSRNFSCLSKAPTDYAVAVTDNYDCGERESTATLCHLGDTVNSNQSVL